MFLATNKSHIITKGLEFYELWLDKHKHDLGIFSKTNNILNDFQQSIFFILCFGHTGFNIANTTVKRPVLLRSLLLLLSNVRESWPPSSFLRLVFSAFVVFMDALYTRAQFCPCFCSIVSSLACLKAFQNELDIPDLTPGLFPQRSISDKPGISGVFGHF